MTRNLPDGPYDRLQFARVSNLAAWTFILVAAGAYWLAVQEVGLFTFPHIVASAIYFCCLVIWMMACRETARIADEANKSYD